MILSVVSPRAQAPTSPTAQAPPSPPPTFRAGTELVVVNVGARDRAGRMVRDLTRDDFAITEDGKPQVATSFDFEDLGAEAAALSTADSSPVLQLRTPVAAPSPA